MRPWHLVPVLVIGTFVAALLLRTITGDMLSALVLATTLLATAIAWVAGAPGQGGGTSGYN